MLQDPLPLDVDQLMPMVEKRNGCLVPHLLVSFDPFLLHRTAPHGADHIHFLHTASRAWSRFAVWAWWATAWRGAWKLPNTHWHVGAVACTCSSECSFSLQFAQP